MPAVWPAGLSWQAHTLCSAHLAADQVHRTPVLDHNASELLPLLVVLLLRLLLMVFLLRLLLPWMLMPSLLECRLLHWGSRHRLR